MCVCRKCVDVNIQMYVQMIRSRKCINDVTTSRNYYFTLNVHNVLCTINCVLDTTMINLRIPQVRYIAALLATIALSFALYPGKSLTGQSSKFFTFLYFFTFVSHYGAQFWMTFVAGLLLFFNLPRIWFGHVQSKLFPLFFCFGFVTSSITIATFISQHRLDDENRQKQIAALVASLGADFINAFLLSPIIVDSMLQRVKYHGKEIW